MLDYRQWTPLPMPSDVITRIDVLAKASQVGMIFTNMRNVLYDDDEYSDSDEDSDDDSDYNSDDASSDDDDDDYDDFIAGVDMDNPDHLNNVDPDDPEAEEPDESNNDDISASQDEDNAADEPARIPELDTNEGVPTKLKKLTDGTGALPPIIQSRTRQQAKETGESLVMGAGAETSITVTKKQRKFRKELQIPLLKREEAENKKAQK
jgi:hypothetical protein